MHREPQGAYSACWGPLEDHLSLGIQGSKRLAARSVAAACQERMFHRKPSGCRQMDNVGEPVEDTFQVSSMCQQTTMRWSAYLRRRVHGVACIGWHSGHSLIGRHVLLAVEGCLWHLGVVGRRRRWYYLATGWLAILLWHPSLLLRSPTRRVMVARVESVRVIAPVAATSTSFAITRLVVVARGGACP